jgi:hypothetical protein
MDAKEFLWNRLEDSVSSLLIPGHCFLTQWPMSFEEFGGERVLSGHFGPGRGLGWESEQTL